ncbi:MAG: hypothetical protein K5989_08850 [Lachnospiraceae bacterium]|nr:hypothetical protein [Lachnospiraceae bacterium]
MERLLQTLSGTGVLLEGQVLGQDSEWKGLLQTLSGARALLLGQGFRTDGRAVSDFEIGSYSSFL